MKALGNDTALILVDIQNDFCPGGALAVREGDKIVPVVNRLIPLFHWILATQDWHPVDHCSFKARAGHGRRTASKARGARNCIPHSTSPESLTTFARRLRSKPTPTLSSAASTNAGAASTNCSRATTPRRSTWSGSPPTTVCGPRFWTASTRLHCVCGDRRDARC